MKEKLKWLCTKQFFIGIVTGILLFIGSFMALAFYWEAHPWTDCDSCMEGTTP